jgi:hypothetical protein
MNEFSLSIHLGNAAAMDQYVIAEALESVASILHRSSGPATVWKWGSVQPIRDYNGNAIGTWSIT